MEQVIIFTRKFMHLNNLTFDERMPFMIYFSSIRTNTWAYVASLRTQHPRLATPRLEPPANGEFMSPVARKEIHTHSRAEHDLELIRAILSGSVESWHAFVDRYTGLILSVLRQQLFAEDQDEIQTVYVDVLEDIYRDKLREFEGNAALSTWLVLVSRGKAVDYLRKKRGRRQLPKGFRDLSAFEQRVFHLHFVEGLGFEAVLQSLDAEGERPGVEAVASAVHRIIDRVDGRHLKRLEYENDARRRSTHAGGLTEQMYRAEVEVWGRERVRTPEQVLQVREDREALDRLEALKAHLPAEDRELLAMRFEEGRTAREISERLEMDGQRSVYTALNRALRRLRDLFLSGEPDGRPAATDFSSEIRRKNR